MAADNSIYEALLNRRNITWTPDEAQRQNMENAIEEAKGFLCSAAGNPQADFSQGDNRNLLITCAWYFVENQRAEFQREYSGDLLLLRLREGFGCGQESAV